MPTDKVLVTRDNLDLLANAIADKSGESVPMTINQMISAVEGISGGEQVEIKQVIFIDYDGTVLYSYTLEEANALTALPENPSHPGLTAQGWNWTLAQIKAQLTVEQIKQSLTKEDEKLFYTTKGKGKKQKVEFCQEQMIFNPKVWNLLNPQPTHINLFLN